MLANKLSLCRGALGAVCRHTRLVMPATSYLRVSSRGNANFIKQVMEQVKRDMEANPEIKKSFEELQKSKGIRSSQTLGESLKESTVNFKEKFGEHYKTASEQAKFFGTKLNETTEKISQMADESSHLRTVRDFSANVVGKAKGVIGTISEKTGNISDFFADEKKDAIKTNSMWKEQKRTAAATKPTPAADAQSAKYEERAQEDFDIGGDLILSDQNYDSTWDRFGFRLKDTPFLRSFYENPLVGKLLGETEIATCIREMKLIDRSFRIMDMVNLVEHVIAPHMVSMYLTGDSDALKTHCGEVAYATVQATINDRLTQKLTLDDNILSLRGVELKGAKSCDVGGPSFIFSFNAQQINCLRDVNGVVVAGAIDDIRQVHYAIALQKHPTPDTNGLQYPWLVTELAIIGNVPTW
eukprot:Platyproteum_vivax@DN516_c0_g1_i1.p1